MEIERINQRFYLFAQASLMMQKKSEHYFSRFNYSACELWLCTEICQIINFDDGNLQGASRGEWFLYNEDYKRDITLYSNGTENTPKISSHIEVKLIYPTVRSKFENAIESLYKKLHSSYNHGYVQEGWVYLVWTQSYSTPSEDFFESREAWIREIIGQKEILDCNGLKMSPAFTRLHDITEGTLFWRGKEKQIIVKAMSFSFVDNFRTILKQVRKDWARAFEILADR